MKILITTDLYTVKTNGVVTSVMNLAEGLRRKGHDVRILTLSDNHVSRIEDNVYYIGSFSMNRVYPGVRGSVSYKSRILSALIKWRPDIIHSQCEFFSFQFAKIIARHCGAPIVHTYHTLYEDYASYVGVPAAANKRVVKSLARHRLKPVGSVVVPSQKVYSILKDYGIDRDMHVIPSGICLDKHLSPISAEKRNEIRKRHGISADAFVLLCLGRLGKEKNIDEILNAMPGIIEKYPSAVLMLVGDGPDRKELVDHAKRLGLGDHAVFIGAVDPSEVHLYYRAADVFVSASTSETQGLVYVEAAANGLPLICRKDPCLDGILSEGENGFSYESKAGFEKGLAKCIASPDFRRLASKKSRDLAMDFSEERFADRIEKLYMSLLEKRRSAE